METDKIEKILEDSRKHLMKHFPFKGQLDLIVLKGHLLIEQLLWQFVDTRVEYPNALEPFKDPNRPFSPKILVRFAQSLDKNEEFAWVWKAIRDLITIRNSLAHRLEDEKLDKKIENLAEYLSRFIGKALTETRDYEMQLKTSIMAILSVLSTLLVKGRGD